MPSAGCHDDDGREPDASQPVPLIHTPDGPNLQAAMTRILLFAALLPLRATPAMSFQTDDPWPALEAVRDLQPRTVTFQSSHPFTTAGIGRAQVRTIQGLLFMPPHATAVDRPTARRLPVPYRARQNGSRREDLSADG
jgi:hypothetical protein